MDIYVKELDGTGFNRLTSDPADDCCPAWSPDGRQIAFLRASGDRGTLYLTSPLGGGERKFSCWSRSKSSDRPVTNGGPPRGIYFIDRSAKPTATICFYDFATRSVRILAPVHGDPAFDLNECLSVSPDEKWLLYSGGISTSDIMMIDNFR